MRTIIFIIITAAMALLSCNNTQRESDAWGNFEARETIISAQAGGRLLSLDIERGQDLNENTPVGLIDTIQYALTHERLVAQRLGISSRLNDIDANIAVLQVQKENISRELERTRRLVADQAATLQQFEDLQGKLVLIEKQVEAAQISRQNIAPELQAMDAQIALALEQRNYCTITNPIEGTVLDKYVESFELVAPGKPLYKIANLSVMDLKVYISGARLPHISLGQKVKVYIDQDADSNQELEGTINWISSKAEFTPKTIQTKEERVNQVYALKVSVPNEGSLKIGMPGEVIF